MEHGQNQHTNQQKAVRNLQTYLRQLSYHDDRIPMIAPDGIYSQDTENAVRIFQELNSLPPTGITDIDTWDLIYRQYEESCKTHTPPEQPTFFPYIQQEFIIKPGDDTFLSRIIHFMLRELSVSYPGLNISDETIIGGSYNEETAESIKTFQRINGLAETGEVDNKTWNQLARAFNSGAHTAQ